MLSFLSSYVLIIAVDGLLRPGLNLRLGDFDRLFSLLYIFFDYSWSLSGHSASHSAGKIGSLGGSSIMHRLLSLLNLLILSGDLVSIFALKIDTDLVIDERDDHAIVERNEG